MPCRPGPVGIGYTLRRKCFTMPCSRKDGSLVRRIWRQSLPYTTTSTRRHGTRSCHGSLCTHSMLNDAPQSWHHMKCLHTLSSAHCSSRPTPQCSTSSAVQLVRFCGRPTDLTPKARFRTLLGYISCLAMSWECIVCHVFVLPQICGSRRFCHLIHDLITVVHQARATV